MNTSQLISKISDTLQEASNFIYFQFKCVKSDYDRLKRQVGVVRHELNKLEDIFKEISKKEMKDMTRFTGVKVEHYSWGNLIKLSVQGKVTKNIILHPEHWADINQAGVEEMIQLETETGAKYDVYKSSTAIVFQEQYSSYRFFIDRIQVEDIITKIANNAIRVITVGRTHHPSN